MSRLPATAAALAAVGLLTASPAGARPEVAASASAGSTPAAAATPPHAARPSSSSSAPARLLVTASEWRLTLSRRELLRGAAVVQLHNRGEDAHDLRLRRVPPHRSGRPPAPQPAVSVPETPSGSVTEVETHLPSGRYRLWCSLPGHRRAGMRATMRVRGGVNHGSRSAGRSRSSREGD